MSHTEKRWIKRVLIVGVLLIAIIHSVLVWMQRQDDQVAMQVAPESIEEEQVAEGGKISSAKYFNVKLKRPFSISSNSFLQAL